MIDKVEKGLELCSASNDTKYCFQCPYNCETHCIECLSQNALDILIKLRSENESLKAELGAAQQAINSMKSKLRAAGLYHD
jgi:hypothetical protein